MTDGSIHAAIDAAADWHARIDAPDMDWTAFGVWLEADPAHREAYDAVASLDAEIADAAPAIAALLPANDDDAVQAPSPSHTRRWRWAAGGAGGALAAGLALLVLAPLATEAPTQLYTTGRADLRSVTLADGSKMEMDRGSRLSVSGGKAPVIDLADGAASFTVRHDPARTLMVRAGGYEIRDIGTRFDVVNARGRLSVAVAEGQVSVAPVGGTAIDTAMLRAGQRLDIDAVTGTAERRAIAPAAVSDWRDGRLDYDGAPLPLVAADISRYAGTPLVVDPSAAGLRFSGVLTIGDGSRLVDQLRAVLPIRARRVGGVVHLGGTGAR